MFGASAPAFGAVTSTAPAFGAIPTSAPAFGATSAPAFGASASGFGFGASSAAGFNFGAPASSAAGFGFGAPAASSAASFGFSAPASSAAGFGFGAPAASSAAGFNFAASSASGFGGFGAPASSAAGFGFGASTSSVAGFGFGAPAASSAAGFGFGPTASSAGFGFGSTGASSPFGIGLASSAPGLWGTHSTTSTAPGLGTMTPGTAIGANPAAAAAASSTEKDLPLEELSLIAEAYNPAPENRRYRFRTFFYNIVDDPNQRVKPPGVDEIRWKEALDKVGGPNNSQRLWPVVASGFADLEARLAQQETTIAQDQQYLDSIRNLLHQYHRQRETATQDRITRMREKHQALHHSLLRVLAKVSCLEGLPGRVSGQPAPELPEGTQAKLHALRDNLQGSASSLSRRIIDLAATAQLRENQDGGVHMMLNSERVTEESLADLQKVLLQQNQALQTISKVLKDDTRDLNILKKALSSSNSSADVVMG